MASVRMRCQLSAGRLDGSSSVTPGSRVFPPFVLRAGGGMTASPVVCEMVKDAADDENDELDAVERASGSCSGAEEYGEGCRGWHGLTLYRCVGCVDG